ncbi:polysaccharide deacetylase family protein [Methylobacter sp. S3L5C]|uniref:polysaccharide deacetylase family protein n=1 Tax=Methylobacter sp. S3L5C TaxID=2839024 RepID=UPI001FAD48C0|nr:polysaccharide deacetylase family protein [Methylobacter sp. S3L5C]UOA10189.1 polysaccharide deacetylase family protein [Methylobacter sp. S3L5C]
MSTPPIYSRIQSRYQRTISDLFFKRSITMHNSAPYISFTFDDFPRSALDTGGDILLKFGLKGTYYASLGLMGTEGPTGMIFSIKDLKEFFTQGHELGCHTFDHCHSATTSPQVFEDSIIKNKQTLTALFPGANFRSFSYPNVGPRPGIKRRTRKYFDCCRSGGQTFNTDTVDLNLLKSYFIEHSRNNLDAIKYVIDQNSRANGWLIFAAHGISEVPSPYQCTPAFFEQIVKYCSDSGARILPVAEALDSIMDDSICHQK